MARTHGPVGPLCAACEHMSVLDATERFRGIYVKREKAVRDSAHIGVRALLVASSFGCSSLLLCALSVPIVR